MTPVIVSVRVVRRVALLLLSSALPLRAQTSRSDPTDLQAWYAVAVKLDLPHRWQASLQERVRMVDDASAFRGYYTTAEVGRSLFGKRVAVSGSYRLAAVDEGAFHRFAGGVEIPFRRGASTISLRSMLQYQRQTFEDDDEPADEDAYLRARFELKHALGRSLDVYGSTEPYLKFGADYPVDNWRNTAGFKWEYAKGRKLDLFYVFRPDYAKSYNRTFHVVGINLDFDVKIGGKGATKKKSD